MSKLATLSGAVAAAVLSTATAASAHSAGEVANILAQQGYSRIDFADATPPNYMLNACMDGVRYHVHVNNYGNVSERREVGSCGIRAEHNGRTYDEQPQRHHRWSGWQRWNRWNRWN